MMISFTKENPDTEKTAFTQVYDPIENGISTAMQSSYKFEPSGGLRGKV